MSMALSQVWVLRVIIGVCALMGLSRGVMREIPTLAGVLLAPMVAPFIADLLPSIGGTAKAAGTVSAAAVAGGRQEMIAFLVVVAVGYILGSLLIHRHPGLILKLLGGLLGAVNGYLIGQYILPRLFPAATTTVVVTGQAVRAAGASAPSPNSGFVLVAAVMVIAGLGVWAASGRTKPS